MKKRWATFVAIAVATTALVAPGLAAASTTEAIAGTGGMTLTLGVVGSPLDIAVTLDEIGHITEVAVGDEFTEDRADEHKVRFSNEDGTTRIDVSAKNHKLKADVRAADLSGITGSHVWTGNLFGSDTPTSVTFDVVENGAGHPELANVAVTSLAPSDALYEIGAVENETEDDEAESVVKITFSWTGYMMTLKIKAEMEFEDDDDDDPSVKLKVELKGKDVQKLRQQSLSGLIGSHTWSGHLCDATPVDVAYTISDSGDVTVDLVTRDGTPTDAFELKTMPHGFKLEFDDSKARVTVELKEKAGGLWDLKVQSKTTEKCHHDDDDGDHDDDDDDDDDRRDKDKKKHDDDDDHDRRDKDKKKHDDDDDEKDDD